MLASLPPSHAEWRAAAASQGEAITRLFLSRVKHAMVSAQKRVWHKAAGEEPLPPAHAYALYRAL